MAEYYTTCAFNLIVEKLAEILHVHLALISIDNGGETIKQDVGAVDILDRADNVAELSDTRGLDKDAVGPNSKLCDTYMAEYYTVSNEVQLHNRTYLV